MLHTSPEIIHTEGMDPVADIKSRLSVEDVVGDYLELRRSGRNFKAISPFTNEKTPSFIVSPEKQIWHCFSSNKGGDMFTFIQEIEGVEFKEAIEILARKAGIDLSQYRQNGNASQFKSRAQQMHAIAVRFYQRQLVKSKPAIEYIKLRGFKRSTVEEFQLGYASNGDGLVKFLKTKGFSETDIIRAGLGVKRRGAVGDMFLNRLMIPLADGQGKVIGFTARTLSDALPKYLNTPQSPIYDKSRHLYGLHLAKEAIRQTDLAVIVEGNLDVISSHQAGIKNVVASAGTAVTSDHLRQINRLTSSLVLALDRDEAGVNATIRTIAIAQTANMQLDIVGIPEGKDPDELIRKDPKLWQATISERQPVVEWLSEHFSSVYRLDSARGKAQFSDHILPVIGQLNDPVEQEHYLKQIAHRLDVSLASLTEKLAILKNKTMASPRRRPIKQEVTTVDESELTQDTLLSLLATFVETRVSMSLISPERLNGAERQSVFRYLASHSDADLSQKLPEELKEIRDYVSILLLKAEELYGSWDSTERSVEAIGLAHRLLHRTKQKNQTELTKAIREAEETGDIKRVKKLLDDYQTLISDES